MSLFEIPSSNYISVCMFLCLSAIRFLYSAVYFGPDCVTLLCIDGGCWNNFHNHALIYILEMLINLGSINSVTHAVICIVVSRVNNFFWETGIALTQVPIGPFICISTSFKLRQRLFAFNVGVTCRIQHYM